MFTESPAQQKIYIYIIFFSPKFNWMTVYHRQIELDVPTPGQLRYLLQMMCRIMNA